MFRPKNALADMLYHISFVDSTVEPAETFLTNEAGPECTHHSDHVQTKSSSPTNDNHKNSN